MSFSYDPAFANDDSLNEVRFRLQDNIQESAILQDEEINAFLPNGLGQALVASIDSMIRFYSRQVNMTADGLKVDYGDIQDALRKERKDIEKEFGLGGVKSSSTQLTRADSNWNK